MEYIIHFHPEGSKPDDQIVMYNGQKMVAFPYETMNYIRCRLIPCPYINQADMVSESPEIIKEPSSSPAPSSSIPIMCTLKGKQYYITMAGMAKSADRTEERVAFWKAIVTMGPTVTDSDIESVYSAYKELIRVKRRSWVNLQAIDDVLEPESPRKMILAEYMNLIAQEIRGICNEVLDLLEHILFPFSVKAQVICLIMKGDYNRYLIEISDPECKHFAIASAQRPYEEGYSLARKFMRYYEPTYLALVLNLCVLYHDLMDREDLAIPLIKKTFDGALIGDMKLLCRKAYKESLLILSQYADNFNMWTRATEHSRAIIPFSFHQFAMEDEAEIDFMTESEP